MTEVAELPVTISSCLNNFSSQFLLSPSSCHPFSSLTPMSSPTLLLTPQLSLPLCGCQPHVTIETSVTMETVGCSSGGSKRLSLSLSLSYTHAQTDRQTHAHTHTLTVKLISIVPRISTPQSPNYSSSHHPCDRVHMCALMCFPCVRVWCVYV